MGVTGLLQLLKSIQKPCNIKKFSGLTLGVDAYGWLHPGTIPCAVDLALGKPTTKYVDYAMHRVKMLIHYGITPYIVFDGNYLPSKAGTELRRAASREEAKRKGLELLKMGKSSAAQQDLQKAVDVTPEMARNLIEELKRLKVEYVVAPYEADAQLAFLERQGHIQGIISEDSDLLVFGARRLITKLDKYGECIEINRDDFTACKTVSFFGWTEDMFRRMAILSGCDYLDGLPKMGLKTAHTMVRRYKDIDRILRVVQFEGKHKVPPGYLEAYRRAESTFLHQWVFDPSLQKLVMGMAWDEHDRPEDISFIGEDVEASIAVGIATGDIHPMTKQTIRVANRTPHKSTNNDVRKRVLQRSNTVATPDDLKGQKKPIDSFFKPRRTPLAELDPNIMTSSPSQQELLRRHSGIVVSRTVDENNTPIQSFAAPSAGRSTGALRTTRTILGQTNHARTVPHPPKRQRLCDDSPRKDKSIAKFGGESGTSKFFSSRLPEPSPSLKRHAKKTEAFGFNILSDDSLEEAMLSLPDFDEPAKPTRGKLSVFQEGKDTSPTTSLRDSQQDSQVSVRTATTTSTLESSDTYATDDTSLSIVPSTPPLEERLNQAGRRGLADIRDRFSLSAQCSGIRMEANTATRLSSLQRMGQAALKRSRGQSTAPAAAEGDQSAEKGQQATADALPALPAWTTGVRSARIAALCGAFDGSGSTQGSEDCCVPNSEDDAQEPLSGDEPDHDADEVEETKPISLGQFVFAG